MLDALQEERLARQALLFVQQQQPQGGEQQGGELRQGGQGEQEQQQAQGAPRRQPTPEALGGRGGLGWAMFTPTRGE